METSWTCTEISGRLMLVHDNRWLAIIGIPLTIVGFAIALGPWLLDTVHISNDWPILAAGSLIGAGSVVMGLALCFKYEEVIGNRNDGTLTQNTGLPPFRRSKTWPLNQFQEVVCLDEPLGRGSGSSLHHRLRLIGPQTSVLLASDLESDTIRFEAERWAGYLNLPLKDKIGEDLKAKLGELSSDRKTAP